VTSFASDDAL